MIFSVEEGTDVGQDGETPVVEDYGIPAPHKFTGQIDKVTVDIKKMEKAGQVERDKMRQTALKRALAE